MSGKELQAEHQCSTCSVPKATVPDVATLAPDPRPTGEPTIGELAASDSRKAAAMKKMGIDFCCGGGKTLKQAADEAGITIDALNRMFVEMEHTPTQFHLGFESWDADFLADYIYNQHHKYFYGNRDRIQQLALKVMQAHGRKHTEMVQLCEFVSKLFDELKSHFYKEEMVLFPYIKELVAYKKTGIHPTFRISISQGPLAVMHLEHEAAGDMLKTIRNLANNYQLPGNACASYQELYTRLEELEGDLHHHIHLENNILFPKALQLEKEFAD